MKHISFANIKLLICDVDGVLTDGTLYYGDNGVEIKGFHVQDGLGLKLLMNAGIEVAIITKRQSEAVSRRFDELGVKHLFQNCSNKLDAYQELKNRLQLEDNAIAYMGDDLPDLPVMEKVGLAIAVANATAPIRKMATYMTELSGGRGAVREVCDHILEAQLS